MKKIILLGLMLVACDKPRSDPSSSTATTTTAATVPNQIVTAADSAIATPPPDPWPAYLPDYPGATVTKKTKDFESLETKDGRDKVFAFYKEKLTAAGFPPGASMNAGAKDPSQPAVMTASKGSAMVQVTVTPAQGTTKISLSIL